MYIKKEQTYVPCACTHGRCWGWGGVGMLTFGALAHVVGATQHKCR